LFGETLALVQAFCFQVPFADASFERVLSSLMLHHLTREEKLETLREVLRVLKPAGRLHVADWGRPHNLLMRVLSVPLRVGDRMNRTTDNVKGLLPELLRSAGFEAVKESARISTAFGTLSLYRAQRAVVSPL
jgi:SAM-dependent methyltransferase